MATHRIRSTITLPSLVRLAIWRLRGCRNGITLKVRSGPRLHIRSGKTTDFMSFYDTFVRRVYEPLNHFDERHVKRVVDLGGNVGHTVLFWLTRYPNCVITTYEPHPAHVQMIHRQLSINGLGERASVRPVAVGSSSGSFFLTDQGWESTVSNECKPGSIPVTKIDLFAELRNEPIDLMKIDCEGGEFEILADERFARLRPVNIVMEVHAHPDGRFEKAYCGNRLRELGYTVNEVGDLLWATLNRTS
jgi:FkbM family methyltransferase